MSKKEEIEEDAPIKLDFGNLKEQLIEVTKAQVKVIQEAMKQPPAPTPGAMYKTPPEQSAKLVESFKNVSEDKWTMKEQWTVAIPNYTVNEPLAHLRDFVWVQELLKTEQGDIANIPYVMDFTFEQLGSPGNAFSATLPEASLIGYVSTVLYEAGRYTDLSYYLLERFDSNLLDLCNQAFANAAVRSEDAKIMALVLAGSGTNYAGNVTRCTGSAYFYSSNIPAALKLMLAQGKAVKPTDCLLYLTPSAYGALLAEMTTSQVIAFAAPGIITQGLIEALFGVKIVVGGYVPRKTRKGAATGTVDVCYLMRPKRAIALAPKRDILIETQKQIATRKLRITASHTFGVKILDFKEIVRIWTSKT